MNKSKDVINSINLAKKTCEELKRPYVCIDLLWHGIFLNHSCSVSTIFDSFGLDVDSLKVFSFSMIFDKKESKSPKTNLNKDVREVIETAEELAKMLDEDELSIEMLMLSLFSGEKRGKIINSILEANNYKAEDFIENTLLFIRDRPLINRFEIKIDETNEDLEEPFFLKPEEENEALDKYAINLNQKALNGAFDGLVDFGDRVKQLSTVLCRTNKPNPILVGPAGGGKTASVEILAREIANGRAGEALNDKVIYEVSLADMVAGTEFRGAFESKFKSLINEAKKFSNVILFFDEIHTLIGAGGTGARGGDLEASNILKPYLARGEISCIGATTDYEYNLKFKKDPALDRRFEKVNIVPPSASQMKGIAPNILDFFKKRNDLDFYDKFSDDAISLCETFLLNKKYPDKYVDVVDHCCAIAKLNGRESITQKDLKDCFKEKVGVLGDESLLKDFKSKVPQSLSKVLDEFSRNINKEKDKPNSVFSFGEGNKVKKSVKNIELFLKSNGIQYISVSAKSLKSKSNISGFAEGYLASLAQRVSILQSPVVIIKDIDSLNKDSEQALLQILEDGCVTMDNGEDVYFNNCLFLLFGNKKKTQSLVGFSSNKSEVNQSGNISDNLKKVVEKEAFLG